MNFKPFFITAAALLVVAAAGAFIARASAQRPYFETTHDGAAPEACFAYEGGDLHVAPGISIRLALGRPMSTMTPEMVELLKAHGATVDSTLYFSATRLVEGHFGHILTKRYIVSLPILDTLTGRPVNTLHNLKFVKAMPGDPTIIGSDIIEHFALEYSRANSTMALHTTAPKGYQRLTDLKAGNDLLAALGQGRGYYINLSVDDNVEPYHIETGIYSAHIKLPARDTTLVCSAVHPGVLETAYGPADMLLADHVWVRAGDRAGTHPAYFGAYRYSEPYAMNPFNFYDQDLLIDFPGRTISLRDKRCKQTARNNPPR